MPADTRTSLMEAASGLLAEHGLAAVTLRDVGVRAGLSRSAPYRHFTGKDDLLAAIAAEGMAELQDTVVKAVRRAPPGRTRLQRGLLAHLRYADEQPGRYALMFGGEVSSPALHDAAGAAHAALLALVREAAPGAEDPHRLTALVFSAVHGAAVLRLAGHLDGGTKWQARPEDVARDLVLLVAEPRG